VATPGKSGQKRPRPSGRKDGDGGGTMRPRPVVLAAWLILATTAVAQIAGPQYKIEKEGRVLQTTRNGQLHLTVQFKITRPHGDLALDVRKDEIVIEEDGQRVTAVEIQQPSVLDAVTAVLALDVSGSMAERDKIEQAKQAARTFLDRLHDQADCGLILFDHRL